MHSPSRNHRIRDKFTCLTLLSLSFTHFLCKKHYYNNNQYFFQGHSTESTESSTSRHQCSTEQPPPMPTLSTETVQRVGSFRSK